MRWPRDPKAHHCAVLIQEFKEAFKRAPSPLYLASRLGIEKGSVSKVRRRAMVLLGESPS